MGVEPHAPEDQERTLGEYLAIIWRSRRLVAVAALALAVCGGLFGLLKTREYESTVLLMPPRRGGGSGFLAQLAAGSPGLAGLAGSLTGDASSPKTYTEILGSRRIREALALDEKLNLMEVYEKETPYLAALVLGKASKHSATRGGLIKISVTDASPDLAAQVANAFHVELNDLLSKLNVTEASLERAFLEKRLAKARGDLSRAEEALRDFQKKNKVIGPAVMASAGMEIYAELKATLIARETRLNVVRTYKAPQDSEVMVLESEVEALRKQLALLEAPRTFTTEPGTDTERPAPGQAIVHLDEVPEVALAYARLLRSFTVQEKLYEYLTMQLEAARIQEARDTPACQVVQPAKAPENPSDLGPAKLAFVGLFAGLVLGALASVLREDGAPLRAEHRAA